MAPPPTASGARFTSRPSPGSRPTGGSMSARESRASGRGSKPRWRRSRANISGSIHPRCTSSSATPSFRPIRAAPGDRAASCGPAARPRAPARNWPVGWRRSAPRCCRRMSLPSRCAMAASSARAAASRSAISPGRSTWRLPICRATSIRMGSRSPAATRRRGSPAFTPARCMPRSLPSIRKPAGSRFSITSWWRTPACWSTR